MNGTNGCCAVRQFGSMAELFIMPAAGRELFGDAIMPTHVQSKAQLQKIGFTQCSRPSNVVSPDSQGNGAVYK